MTDKTVKEISEELLASRKAQRELYSRLGATPQTRLGTERVHWGPEHDAEIERLKAEELRLLDELREAQIKEINEQYESERRALEDN